MVKKHALDLNLADPIEIRVAPSRGQTHVTHFYLKWVVSHRIQLSWLNAEPGT